MSCSDPEAARAASAFAYDLPRELIAQVPAARRGDARLMLVERGGAVLGDRRFRDLPQLLEPGDLLVLNESRVLPARLWSRRASGGRVELLLIAPRQTANAAAAATPSSQPDDAPLGWRALARPARRLRVGEELTVTLPPSAAAAVRAAGDGAERPTLVVRELLPDGYVVVASAGSALPAIADAWGEMPLPPYIRRDAATPDLERRRRDDRRRYQTVYARRGRRAARSVAAPTAGLHFSARTLDRLAQRGIELARVTLHVGPGTFRPPTPDQYRRRRLHGEAFLYGAATDAALAAARRRGGRVIAVGTTTLRVLETVARLDLSARRADAVAWRPDGDDPEPVFCGDAIRGADGWEVTGETRLFLRPPDAVTAADGLLTNFHLPGSSLLMLVAVIAGEATWRAAYAHAVAAGWRFYSYGDAMLLLPSAARRDGGPVAAANGGAA